MLNEYFFVVRKLEKYSKTLKIPEEPQKQSKIPRKIIQNQTKTPKRHPNTQIIFSENLNFYSKPKIISKNLNPELKKIYEIPKYTQIYLIYTIFFGYFGYPIGSRIGPGLKSRSADPKKNDPTGTLVWPQTRTRTCTFGYLYLRIGSGSGLRIQIMSMPILGIQSFWNLNGY